MATLQTTFKYEGNASASLIKNINLAFKSPLFEFDKPLINGKPFLERKQLGEKLISTNKKLTDSKYDVNINNEYLIGASDNSVENFLEYITKIGFSNLDKSQLDSLSAEILLSISDESKNLTDQTSIQALYSLSTSSPKYKELFQRQSSFARSVAVNTNALNNRVAEWIDYTRGNIFLINKDIFLEAAAKFKIAEPQFNDYAFLFIISHVTDISSGSPKIMIDADEIQIFLKTNFAIDKPERVKAILRLIKDNLYDFPISVPEIKTLDVKGTFKINAGTNVVSFNDFKFYAVSLEYTIQVPDNGIHPISHMFDWNNVQASQLNNNTVPFSFPTTVANLINSNVKIRVTGYDGSEVWQKEYSPTNEELKNVNIEVELLKPAIISVGDEPKPVKGGKKLSGKIIEMGDCKINDVTVVIQAKKEADTLWRIVGAATTDTSGNFSLPYPYGNYIAAQALVSLTPNSPADIPINTDQNDIDINETIADDFLYLLVEGADCTSQNNQEEDCECHDGKKSNRLPDQEELLVSDSYTQDIGGSCINLSTPNRTLNEYSHTAIVRTSDPDVSNYILTKDAKGNFKLEGGLTKIDRKPVDISNPIYWQDAPDDHNNLSLYQAVKVATGHILHYNVVTKADGYSMGELLYSLPLAPGQKKQIVMFEQSHTLQGSETQRISQNESLAASLVNDVDISDTIAGNINEDVSGRSSATTAGVSGGFGLGAIIDAVGVSLGVSGGVANAHSTASQNSSRAISAYFHERMKNSITQNAQSYREMNATVISTVQEGQQYGVTSEVIANHNHCHSLTMMYFEVLKHYAIYQELSHVEECLFVPLLMTDFTRENVFKWRDVLAKHLLPMPSETYLQPFTVIKYGRQHPLLKGFDAIDRIKTFYLNVDFPDGAYDDEIINFFTGEMYIQTNLPRPKTKYDRIKSWPLVKRTSWSWSSALIAAVLGGPLAAISGGYLNADSSINPEGLAMIDRYMSVDANFASVPPAQCIRIRKIDIHFFEDGGFDKAQWMAYGRLLGKTDEIKVIEWLSYYFSGRLISEWDNIFYNDIAPALFAAIISNMSIGGFSAIDFSADRKYKGGEALMKLNLRGNGSNKKRKEITELNILFDNFANLQNDLVTLTVKNFTVRYSTSHYNGILYSGFVNDDLYDGVYDIATPENANEKRNPKKEDAFIAQKLIEHLNSNLEHYNKWLWKELDKDRLYMLLDGFNIETYNDFGLPIGSRSLASVVKNQLIGISGNSLIMPVAPGYKIDRTYIVEQPIEGPAQEINLLDHYKPLTPIPAYRISLPSKGVFAEAVQGACDACEKVKENTSQDWDKFKTDEPTSINPVTVPVPEVTDWKAAFKDFATPIVNIQNAPAAPAPGAGLAASGIADLLGKNDIFKDITGLDQNQKNAMQTYLSNQENAKAFAEMAKEMAMQGHNTEHADKIADAIRNSPELSNEEKAQLLKDHFGQMVDGGQSKKAEQDAAGKSKEPTAMGIAKDAEAKGKNVKAETQDSDGNTQKVEVGAGAGDIENFRVTGTTYWVSQGQNINACWAAAATMMKSWKDHKKYSIEEVLAMTPAEYLQKYTQNQSLLASEKGEFITSLGMIDEPPASYTFDTYIEWLKQFGPIWVTVDSNENTNQINPHARILVGYDGDGTEQNSQLVFLDPAVSGEQKVTFTEFLEEYEQMVTDNPDDLFIQIVHFKNEIVGEGAGSTPNKVNLSVAWTGVNSGDLDADIQIKSGSTLLGSSTGNGSANILIDWKNSYSIIITPRLNSASENDPDKMYIKTIESRKNIASKVDGDPASLSLTIKLNVNRWNLTHVHNSWINEGVVRSKAEDVINKTFLGKNVTINKLVESKLISTQAQFDALPANELERIKLSILKIGSRTLRTMTGTEGTFSNHSLGCAFDVNENMDTKQNHHFLESDEQKLLKLVEEVIRKQVAGWNNFDIINDKGLKQLDASNHFTNEFPKWLYMYASSLAPEESDDTLAEIPWLDYYSTQRLKRMITSLNGTIEEKERLTPLFQTVIDYKPILTTWLSGININGVWLTGMISLDRKFLEIMLSSGWRWGGDYNSLKKDYMHFEDMDAVALIKT